MYYYYRYGPLSAKIRFNPFDSVPLATLRFEFLDVGKGRLMKNSTQCSIIIEQGVRVPYFARIFADKGNIRTRFGTPIYYPISSRFLNKTDLEQYLFKKFSTKFNDLLLMPNGVFNFYSKILLFKVSNVFDKSRKIQQLHQYFNIVDKRVILYM